MPVYDEGGGRFALVRGATMARGAGIALVAGEGLRAVSIDLAMAAPLSETVLVARFRGVGSAERGLISEGLGSAATMGSGALATSGDLLSSGDLGCSEASASGALTGSGVAADSAALTGSTALTSDASMTFGSLSFLIVSGLMGTITAVGDGIVASCSIVGLLSSEAAVAFPSKLLSETDVAVVPKLRRSPACDQSSEPRCVLGVSSMELE